MKRVLGFILFMAGSTVVSAQNTSLGPTLGINGWTDADNNAKVGLNIGATFTYSASVHWAFGLDVKYSMEGGGKTISPKVANVTEDYVRVPLKIVYFFGERGQRFRPKLYIGPSFGFLVGGKINAIYNGTVIPELSTKDYVKSFDAGLLMGTGFNYRLTKGTWLNIDLGYTAGFTNVVKDDTNASIYTSLPSFKNKNLAFNVGVSFPLGTIKSTKTKKS